MARIQLHTARDFLPSSFCSKRTSTRLFLPPFCKKIHHRPFTQINLLMHLLLTLFWTFEFPSQQKSIECTLPSPILTGQISSCCRDASKVYCEGYWLIFLTCGTKSFVYPHSLTPEKTAALRVLSHVWLFETPWTVARQAPLSIEFSRQGYWSGLSFPPPGDLPDPGIEPMTLASPVLAGRFLTTRTTREATWKR